MVKNLWRKLKYLRRFYLYNLNDLNNKEPYGIEVACPLDENDEPPSRYHPALEQIDVSFLRRSLWRWNPEHGWV